jgi:hypothetical protein
MAAMAKVPKRNDFFLMTKKMWRSAPHVLRRDDSVIVEVDAAVPVLEARICCLVLFRKDEVDKVLVAHLVHGGA